MLCPLSILSYSEMKMEVISLLTLSLLLVLIVRFIWSFYFFLSLVACVFWLSLVASVFWLLLISAMWTFYFIHLLYHLLLDTFRLQMVTRCVVLVRHLSILTPRIHAMACTAEGLGLTQLRACSLLFSVFK